jgi:hypothetical protein
MSEQSSIQIQSLLHQIILDDSRKCVRCQDSNIEL